MLDCHGDNIAKFAAKTRETHDGCGDVLRKTRLGQDTLVDQFNQLGQNYVLLTSRNKFWQLEPLFESTVAKNRESDRAECASGRAKRCTLKSESELIAQLCGSRAIGSDNQDVFGRSLAGEAQKVRLQRCGLAAARPPHRERDGTERQVDDLLLADRKLERVDRVDKHLLSKLGRCLPGRFLHCPENNPPL